MKKIWVWMAGLVVIAGIIGGAGSRQIVKAEEENLEAVQDFQHISIIVSGPAILKQYEAYYTEENYTGHSTSTESGEITGITFEIVDESKEQITSISIYTDAVNPAYNALEDFKENYPDIWAYILDKQQSDNDAYLEEMNKFSNILKCLNVIDWTPGGDYGFPIEATFYCNENKTLEIKDADLLFEIQDSEEWSDRVKDYYEIEEESYKTKLDHIAKGKLVFLERDKDGNYTYFAIAGSEKDEDGFDTPFEVSGKYYEGDGTHDPEFYLLGSYIVKNEKEWEEKIDWFENERDEWLKQGGNASLIFGGGDSELLAKWVKELSNEELYNLDYIPFKDIDYSAWYIVDVFHLKFLEVIGGYKDENGQQTGYFKPESEVSNAEFIKMVLNVFGMGENLQGINSPYWDNEEVNNIPADAYENHWALKFYKIAKYLKTRLVLETDFDLNRPIKRKEVIGLMKDIMAKYLPAETQQDTSCFTDLSIEDKYSTDICLFNQLSYVAGYEDGTFKPDNNINRAEAAHILDYIYVSLGEPIYDSTDNPENEICEYCEDCILFTEFLKRLIEDRAIAIDVTGNPTFEHIDSTSEYYPYAATALNLGILDTQISPTDEISRVLAAKIITDLMKWEDSGENINLPTDVLQGSWFDIYVRIFIEKGLHQDGQDFYPADSLKESDFENWLDKI